MADIDVKCIYTIHRQFHWSPTCLSPIWNFCMYHQKKERERKRKKITTSRSVSFTSANAKLFGPQTRGNIYIFALHDTPWHKITHNNRTEIKRIRTDVCCVFYCVCWLSNAEEGQSPHHIATKQPAICDLLFLKSENVGHTKNPTTNTTMTTSQYWIGSFDHPSWSCVISYFMEFDRHFGHYFMHFYFYIFFLHWIQFSTLRVFRRALENKFATASMVDHQMVVMESCTYMWYSLFWPFSELATKLALYLCMHVLTRCIQYTREHNRYVVVRGVLPNKNT